MAYPVRLSRGKQLKFSKLRTEQFRALDMSSDHTQIENDQSPYMRNMYINKGGSLKSRFGYQLIKDFTTGVNNGILELGTKKLVVIDDKIYDFIDDGTTNLLYTGANAIHRAFEYDSKLYIQNGTEYLVYDGVTVVPVVGKIPLMTIGTPPSGGGTTFEQKNLIQAGFKQSFNGDGSTTLFQGLFDNLDATEITIDVDTVTLVENVDFTVNRTLGQYTFVTPPSNNVDNVIVTAYKTIAGDADFINKCTFAKVYGGQQDFKVFISGNPDLVNYDWGSGTLDPTYFPQLGFDVIGFNDQPITGYAKQYDSLVIYKYNDVTKDKSMYVRNINIGTEILFSTKPINDERGATSPDVIQVLNGVPVSIDDLGGFKFSGGQVRDERNVKDFTERINYQRNKTFYDNLGILEGGTLVTEEFDRKMWIADESQSVIYVYDWVLDEFYLYDNIKASRIKRIGTRLYFGDSEGKLYKLKDRTDDFTTEELFTDIDTPVLNEYYSKNMDFLTPEIQDQINSMFVTILPENRTSIELWTRTDRDSNFRQQRANSPIEFNLFVFSTIKFSEFTFGANIFPQTAKANVKAKKVNNFQYKLVNRKAEEVTVTNTVIKVLAEREVKQ